MGLWARVKLSASERLARGWTPAAVASRAERPIVSFTFDDFPKSAVDNGARLLKSRGVRGSFYASGRFAASREDGIDYFDQDDLRLLAEDGHEIGCHTFGHLRLPVTRSVVIGDDLRRNGDFVAEALGDYRMRSFAYPFGHVDVSKKVLIGRRFRLSRGIFPGVNRGRVDVQQLRAIPLEQRSFDHDAAMRAFDVAQKFNGWVIFFSHDVSNTPSRYGCTPDTLARLADAALHRGFKSMPVVEAAAQVAPDLKMPSTSLDRS